MKYAITYLLLFPALCFGLPRDMVHPLGTANVSSGFGTRFHPVMQSMRHHDGIDLPCPMRTPVRSLAKGTVIRVGTDSGYGKFVIVFHGAGWSSVYAHLSAQNVEVGRRLKAGEILGLAGATGRVTGPHLHFELRRDGVAVDPLTTLPFLTANVNG